MERVELDVPLGERGDAFERYRIRMEEMRQSVRILAQALERLAGLVRRRPRGLRDVIVAANHLAALAADRPEPAALDGALAAIQREREPEIRRAQKLQRREAHGQGDARAGGWQYNVARAGARALGRYRWAQRAWFARQRDLRFGSSDVRLLVDLPRRPRHDRDRALEARD